MSFLDLDDLSFRVFIPEILPKHGLVFGIKTELLEGKEIELKAENKS